MNWLERFRKNRTFVKPICEECGLPMGCDGSGSRHLMGGYPYIDESGVVHPHTINQLKGDYRCANGHYAAYLVGEVCPIKGCDWKLGGYAS